MLFSHSVIGLFFMYPRCILYALHWFLFEENLRHFSMQIPYQNSQIIVSALKALHICIIIHAVAAAAVATAPVAAAAVAGASAAATESGT